jgi:hypothetical protein
MHNIEVSKIRNPNYNSTRLVPGDIKISRRIDHGGHDGQVMALALTLKASIRSWTQPMMSAMNAVGGKTIEKSET